MRLLPDYYVYKCKICNKIVVIPELLTGPDDGDDPNLPEIHLCRTDDSKILFNNGKIRYGILELIGYQYDKERLPWINSIDEKDEKDDYEDE